MEIPFLVSLLLMVAFVVNAEDTNPVYSPCRDTTIQRWDGFTFGLAFSSSRDQFFFNQTQLSPCDSRLQLAAKGAQLAVFRPKVDEISLLTIESTVFDPYVKAGGFMVAFAGQKYAARSSPVFVSDGTHIVSSFTLVLEFEGGILHNLYWNKFGCESCKGEGSICIEKQDCATPTSKCKSNGGPMDCKIGIQLAFSGTDKNSQVLNSWYEVEKLRQYWLFALFADLRDPISNQYGNLF